MWKLLVKLAHIIKGDYTSPDVIPKYEFIDNGNEELSKIKIVEGLYKGTLYRYGAVGILPEGDGVKLSFTTDIELHPGWGKIKETDIDFTTISGNILRQIILMSSDTPGKFLVM